MSYFQAGISSGPEPNESSSWAQTRAWQRISRLNTPRYMSPTKPWPTNMSDPRWSTLYQPRCHQQNVIYQLNSSLLSKKHFPNQQPNILLWYLCESLWDQRSMQMRLLFLDLEANPVFLSTARSLYCFNVCCASNSVIKLKPSHFAFVLYAFLNQRYTKY